MANDPHLSFSVNDHPTIGSPPIGIDAGPDIFGKDIPASLRDIQSRVRLLVRLHQSISAELLGTNASLNDFRLELADWIKQETLSREKGAIQHEQGIAHLSNLIGGVAAHLQELDTSARYQFELLNSALSRQLSEAVNSLQIYQSNELSQIRIEMELHRALLLSAIQYRWYKALGRWVWKKLREDIW